jgi:hypothetical protein
MKAILHRNASTVFGTFGYLDLVTDTGARIDRFCTAEDDWLDNAPRESCIPTGLYRVEAVESPRFGPTFEITKVPGRSHILFHAGNTEEDTSGCILIGDRFGVLTVRDEDAVGKPVTTKWAVLDSKAAFQRFRNVVGTQQWFALDVRWDFHGWR